MAEDGEPAENRAMASTEAEAQPNAVATNDAHDEEQPPQQRPALHRGRTSRIDAVTTTAAAAGTRLRSTTMRLLDADAPLGMWAASSQLAARAPTVVDIRQGQFGQEGWHAEAQAHHHTEHRLRRASTADSETMPDGDRRWKMFRRTSTAMSSRSTSETAQSPTSPGHMKRTATGGVLAPLAEGKKVDTAAEKNAEEVLQTPNADAALSQETSGSVDDDKKSLEHESTADTEKVGGQHLPAFLHPEPSGYIPPPKLPWTTSTWIGLKAFWWWFLTPMGFLITIYGLNVVAWGGMIFLLLLKAAPAMCHPTCNDFNSPRRKWIEIDAQILNALFCVTGFGLAPWRFRDLWWLLVWRLGIRGRAPEQRAIGLRRLAGIHRQWFRLPSSDTLGEHFEVPLDKDLVLDDPRTPIPAYKTPEDPLTGIRAPPTGLWKMDFVVWNNIWNTFGQAALSGIMWGMNRRQRPSWATGFLITFACVVAGIAGLMMFYEGKRVKRVEGVPAEVVQNIMDIERKAGVVPPTVEKAQHQG